MRSYLASILLGLGCAGGISAQSNRSLAVQQAFSSLPTIDFTALSFPAGQSGGTAQSLQAHQNAARRYLQEKKPALAIPEFAAIVVADPKNLDAQANLGVLLYFQQQFSQAEPHLRAALDLQPDLANIQALLGMCDHQMGNDTQARGELEAALPKLQEIKVRVQAGLQLIEIYTASRELAKASPVIESLRQLEPTDPRVLFAAYRVYTDLAGEAMLDLSLAAPTSGQMHQAMAHELERQRNEKGAISNYQQAIAADPHLPGIHYELAEVLHASSEVALHAEAEEQYQLALEANPRDVSSITRLGDIASGHGDAKRAEALYRKALAIQPGEADASIGLAKIMVDQSQLAPALPLLLGVIATDPTNQLAHFRLSALYRRMNRPEDAKREIDIFEKYKVIKDRLRKVYEELRENAPQGTDAGK